MARLMAAMVVVLVLIQGWDVRMAFHNLITMLDKGLSGHPIAFFVIAMLIIQIMALTASLTVLSVWAYKSRNRS